MFSIIIVVLALVNISIHFCHGVALALVLHDDFNQNNVTTKTSCLFHCHVCSQSAHSTDVQLATYFLFHLLLEILSPLVISYLLCLCSYRTYMRPRYKVAYKVVTEMEWKCCYGYSGEDCNDGSVGGAGNQISTTRPQPRPGPGRGVQGGGGGGGQGLGDYGGVSHGSGQSGGHSGEWILIYI